MIQIELEPFSVELDDQYISDQLGIFGLRSQTRVRQEMRKTPRGGSVRKVNGRTHTASTPGAFPAVDTGALAASIGYDAGRTRLRIGAGSEYAGWVNDGTSRMAARPFLEPGFNKTYSDWPAFMSDFIRVT